MIPQLGPVVPAATGLQVPTEPAAAREAPRAGIDRPPLPPAAAETARAVEPPSAAARAADAPRPDLNPPDPEAPAGPPPAFEASILDQARARAAEPGDRDAGQTAPAEPAGPVADRGAPDPYEVPPSADARAQAEVATLRRIETPWDTATVDVSR